MALSGYQRRFQSHLKCSVENTFEGHTIVPTIQDFIGRNKVKAFTVIADAAMISSENISQLNQNEINYIVGARMGNLNKAS